MSDVDPRLIGLGTLLQLQKDARHASDLLALHFILANDTHRLLRYHQAVVWSCDSGQPRLKTASGLAQLERDAPFVRWLERLLSELDAGVQGSDAAVAEAPRAIATEDIPAALLSGWREWSAGHALYCPLSAPDGRRLGGLWLNRATPFDAHEISLLNLLLDAYGHAWWALIRARRANPLALLRRGWLRILVLVALIAGLFLPVRQSVLAPARVAPVDPMVVAAPHAGVVQRFHVQPNQPVHTGELLFELDDTELRNQLEIARKELAVAEAEYLQASRKAFQDARTKGELALLEARRDQHLAEVSYTAELLERIRVKSARDGVAVFRDVNDWLGRPVSPGEKVLSVADPRDTELEIDLPLADALNLEAGAEILLFLDTDPLNPLPATLVRSAYEAEVTAAGVLALRLQARFDQPEQRPRIGLQGTARIFGAPTRLGYYLLRRPLAAARQWLGL